MKFRLAFIFMFAIGLAHAQKIDRNHFYGNWKIQGILLRGEVVSFWQPDTLIKKLIQKRKKEFPNRPIPKGDSIAIEMGAHFLCEVLNNLEIQVSKTNEILFLFAGGKIGSEDTRMHILQFDFVNDTLLNTTDEKGYKSDLTIKKLTPAKLIISGISSARYMELVFRKQE